MSTSCHYIIKLKYVISIVDFMIENNMDTVKNSNGVRLRFSNIQSDKRILLETENILTTL